MSIIPFLPLFQQVLGGILPQTQPVQTTPVQGQMNPQMLILLLLLMKDKENQDLMPLLLLQMMGGNPVQYTQTLEQLKKQKAELEKAIEEMEKK